MNNNVRDLELELEWFAEILDTRIKAYFSSGPAATLCCIYQLTRKKEQTHESDSRAEKYL